MKKSIILTISSNFFYKKVSVTDKKIINLFLHPFAIWKRMLNVELKYIKLNIIFTLYVVYSICFQNFFKLEAIKRSHVIKIICCELWGLLRKVNIKNYMLLCYCICFSRMLRNLDLSWMGRKTLYCENITELCIKLSNCFFTYWKMIRKVFCYGFSGFFSYMQHYIWCVSSYV